MKRVIKKLKPGSSQNKSKKEEGKGRVTNENIIKHRREVISEARKQIYPLQGSKNRLLKISVAVFVASVLAFLAYVILAFYYFKQSNEFLYNVTRVVPFPIARIGSDFVAYENYLFEINHFVHYYTTQENVDFDSETGRRQLDDFKKRSLEKVIDDAYIKQLAKENNVTVTDQEVDQEIALIRSQGRFGSNEEEFENVLRDFWDWSVDDFKRTLKQQLLAQKLASKLDTQTHDKADRTYAQLQNGANFEKLARQVSEDVSTKNNGGRFGLPISKTDRNFSPRTVDTLFNLEEGEYSTPVDVGYGLEIVRVLNKEGDQVRGAHILFNFKDLSLYLDDYKEENPARLYVSFD